MRHAMRRSMVNLTSFLACFMFLPKVCMLPARTQNVIIRKPSIPKDYMQIEGEDLVSCKAQHQKCLRLVPHSSAHHMFGPSCKDIDGRMILRIRGGSEAAFASASLMAANPQMAKEVLSSSLLSQSRKIGFVLVGLGMILSFLGFMLFLNRTLIGTGNLMLVTGVILIAGVERSKAFLFRRERARGSTIFILGVFLVLRGYARLGVMIEMFGILNLFGNFIPALASLLKSLPVIGPALTPILDAPIFTSAVDAARRFASSAPPPGFPAAPGFPGAPPPPPPPPGGAAPWAYSMPPPAPAATAPPGGGGSSWGWSDAWNQGSSWLRSAPAAAPAASIPSAPPSAPAFAAEPRYHDPAVPPLRSSAYAPPPPPPAHGLATPAAAANLRNSAAAAGMTGPKVTWADIQRQHLEQLDREMADKEAARRGGWAYSAAPREPPPPPPPPPPTGSSSWF